jgi:transcriptional regulator with XRE-family HTH domain
MGASTALSLEISRRVEAAIKESNLSPTRVAGLSGMARETLRRRLKGAHPFTVDELEAIAMALKLPRDAFLNSKRWKKAA